MQHHGDTDVCAEMFGISRNRAQRFSGGLEQQVINYRFVLVSQLANRRRQCEYRMEVFDGQQLCLACVEPTVCSRRLALGTMSITARVVSDLKVLAFATAQHVTAEFGTAAAFNGGHDFQLAETELATMLQPKGITAGAENIRNLQVRACHTVARCQVGSFSTSSGLCTSRSKRVAT